MKRFQTLALYSGFVLTLTFPSISFGLMHGSVEEVAEERSDAPPAHHSGPSSPHVVPPHSGRPAPGPVHPGHSNPGHTSPGLPNPGNISPGRPNPGHTNPGHHNPGNISPGRPNPGHVSPGLPNPGHPNPGIVTPGHRPNPGFHHGPGARPNHGGWGGHPSHRPPHGNWHHVNNHLYTIAGWTNWFFWNGQLIYLHDDGFYYDEIGNQVTLPDGYNDGGELSTGCNCSCNIL